MTPTPTFVSRLFLINSSLLIAHEIDSAYWHEWELFGLPGGIQLFVLLHIPLVAVLFVGYQRVVEWTRRAKVYSFLLAAVGVGAYTIHSAFHLAGSPGFDNLVSKGLLWTILIVSLIQIVVTQLCSSPSETEVS